MRASTISTPSDTGRAPDQPGYDLLGAFVGSEGTLGITTTITLRLLRKPEAVRTLLAAFESTDHAGDAVSRIIGAGIVPAAIEMMDALAMEAAEAAVHVHYPEGAGAVLVVELDGPAAEVEHQFEEVERLCREAGSTTIQIAEDDDQRALFWKGRKSAFAAVGRISPDYYVQDGVIPRTALPEVLRKINRLAEERGCRLPSPAWKTLATRSPRSAASWLMRRSTSGRAVRGMTPSWT